MSDNDFSGLSPAIHLTPRFAFESLEAEGNDNRVRVQPEDQPAVERLARHIMRPLIRLQHVAWKAPEG